MDNMVKPVNEIDRDMRNNKPHSDNFFQPEKSAPTKAAYLARAKNILSEIEFTSGNPSIYPVDIAEWLLVKSESIRPATLRLYRAALTYFIRQSVSSGLYDANHAEAAIQSIGNMRGCATSSIKTSALKSKSISQKKINELVEILSARRSKFAHAAAVVFQATIVTGLRPVEWFTAKITKDTGSHKYILTVENAKATNGRSFGFSRQIEIPGEEYAIIVTNAIAAIASLKNSGHSQSSIYNEIRKAIGSAGVTNSGRRVSLYTARHQFVANMKNIHTKEDVARLLGHGSIDTATTHYGKRRSGHQSFKEIAKPVNSNQMESKGSSHE